MRTTRVYGPAYLDRVVRVDRPLATGNRFDGSLDGAIVAGEPSSLLDRAGNRIRLLGIDEDSRPLGEVRVDGQLGGDGEVRVVSDTDDLGGMGAGFAKALGGTLISALGTIGDPVGDRVSVLLSANGIPHDPIRVADRPSDWSLIVSSGEFGDKLAVGFRGCHAAVDRIAVNTEPCDLLVVASLPNRLIAQALVHPTRIRMLGPAMRNARDGSPPLSSLAGKFDVLCLNRGEWEAMPGRDAIREQTPIVVVTDGPRGCSVAFRDRSGQRCQIDYLAFPRSRPPRDTNRAGEAFASAFVTHLLDHGWTPGPSDSAVVEAATQRGSAAAALVLDLEAFGFPSAEEIDAAIWSGVVGAVDSPAGPA